MSNHIKQMSTAEAKLRAKEFEREGVKLLIRPLSKRKQAMLFIVTTLACIAPTVIGLKYWGDIPESVSTGIVSVSGEEDPLPRWVGVFGFTGLMCILNAIVHMKFITHLKRFELPPASSRVVGRWGFSLISVLLFGKIIIHIAGADSAYGDYLAVSAVALIIMVLGGIVFECPRDSKFAIRLSCCRDEESHRAVHDLAGTLWMCGSAVMLYGIMSGAFHMAFVSAAALILILIPIVFGYIRANIKGQRRKG